MLKYISGKQKNHIKWRKSLNAMNGMKERSMLPGRCIQDRCSFWTYCGHTMWEEGNGLGAKMRDSVRSPFLYTCWEVTAAWREWSHKLDDGKARVLEGKIGNMVSQQQGKWLLFFLEKKGWWRVSSAWSANAEGHCLSMPCFKEWG